MLDDQRIFLPWYVRKVSTTKKLSQYHSSHSIQVLQSERTRQYVNGIAVHWYLDEYIPASALTRTKKLFPEMFLLATEASNMPEGGENAVLLGSWLRGELYSTDIIEVRTVPSANLTKLGF